MDRRVPEQVVPHDDDQVVGCRVGVRLEQVHRVTERRGLPLAPGGGLEDSQHLRREDDLQVVVHVAVGVSPRRREAARLTHEDVDLVAVVLERKDHPLEQRVGRVHLRVVRLLAAAVGRLAAAAEGLPSEQHGDPAVLRQAGGERLAPGLVPGGAPGLASGVRQLGALLAATAFPIRPTAPLRPRRGDPVWMVAVVAPFKARRVGSRCLRRSLRRRRHGRWRLFPQVGRRCLLRSLRRRRHGS